jgi:hypothetical protein
MLLQSIIQPAEPYQKQVFPAYLRLPSPPANITPQRLARTSLHTGRWAAHALYEVDCEEYSPTLHHLGRLAIEPGWRRCWRVPPVT